MTFSYKTFDSLTYFIFFEVEFLSFRLCHLWTESCSTEAKTLLVRTGTSYYTGILV
jgi:hypothetical protein